MFTTPRIVRKVIVINLELDRRDAIVLRHHLFLYTKDHPGFFSDEGILKNQRNFKPDRQTN